MKRIDTEALRRIAKHIPKRKRAMPEEDLSGEWVGNDANKKTFDIKVYNLLMSMEHFLDIGEGRTDEDFSNIVFEIEGVLNDLKNMAPGWDPFERQLAKRKRSDAWFQELGEDFKSILNHLVNSASDLRDRTKSETISFYETKNLFKELKLMLQIAEDTMNDSWKDYDKELEVDEAGYPTYIEDDFDEDGNDWEYGQEKAGTFKKKIYDPSL